MKNKTKFITTWLIVFCVLVYGYTIIKYGFDIDVYEAIDFWGYNPVLVSTYKEYYRLITANFMHFSLMHIVFNCSSLYNIGYVLEMLFEKKRFIIIVISSMLSTTLIPQLIYAVNETGASTVSGGISGVIFGLIGSIIAGSLIEKGVFKSLLNSIYPSVVMMLMLSVLVASISMIGHVSGLIGGFISTVIVLKVYPLENNYVVI